MLQIVIPGGEMWDEEKQEFVSIKDHVLQLEHSLISLSKWESKWCKPFYSKEDKTPEETLDYVKCMAINTVDDYVYRLLSDDNVTKIKEYIEAPMTATTINEAKTGRINNEMVTSELIYYWMVALQIPFECQKWHLNRLITLIRVCNIKNQPPKKMGKRDMMSKNAALNAARRKQMGTRG